MIIVRLKGGLGNQLFQYAVGRHLAEIRQVVLKIDISFFETYTLHTYSMWPFDIQENFATREEVMELATPKESILDRFIGRVIPRPPKPAPTFIQEKYFHFDPNILSLPDNVYLDGHWQSEKYFANIKEIIRREFTVKTPQTGKDKELSELIGSSESVSLHIRRGSYVFLPEANQTHGTCSMNYYYRCVDHLIKSIKNPHFFVFSDEPDWARDNLKLAYPTTFVEHNSADKDYEDLRLMSQCKHHIIANSTFSWWGAWLSKNPGKIVLAPKKWFNKSKSDIKDLIPNSWYRI